MNEAPSKATVNAGSSVPLKTGSLVLFLKSATRTDTVSGLTAGWENHFARIASMPQKPTSVAQPAPAGIAHFGRVRAAGGATATVGGTIATMEPGASPTQMSRSAATSAAL